MTAINYHEGIPIERLKELEGEGITEYKLKIARRGDSGNHQSLRTVNVTMAEVLDIEEMLNMYAGGGNYFLQAFHKSEVLNRLFAFKLNIAGSAKIPLDRAPANMRPAQNPMSRGETEDPRSMSAQLFTVPAPPDAGTTFGPPLMSSGRYATPVASRTSDEVALGQVEDERRARHKLELQLEELRDERARERVEHSARLEQERKDRDRTEREAEKQRHAAELQTLKDMIQNKPKGFDLPAVVAAAVPFLPLAIALLDSRRHATQAIADRDAKMVSIQMEGANRLMDATLARSSQKPDGLAEMLKTALPLALPMITTLLASSGPKAQAELMTAQADVQMQQIGMLAQMVEQVTSSAPESPYIPLIQTAMDTIAAGVQAYAKANAKPSMGQAVLSTLNQQFGGQPADPALAAQTTATAPSRPQGERTPGELVADSVFAHPACPPELKTQEWFTVIAMLHDAAPVDAVAETLANHLSNLDTLKTTPAFLEPVWTDPEKTLYKILSFLPVWQNNILYAKQVVSKVIGILSEPGPDEEDDDGEGDEDADEETVSAEAVEAAAE